MLRLRVVHRDNRHLEGFVFFHRPEADNARRCLLHGAPERLEKLRRLVVYVGDEVAAVVHGYVRPRGCNGFYMVVISFIIFAPDGERIAAVNLDQSRGNVVLRGKRVRRAQVHRGAARDERAHEVRRLGRHVHAAAQRCALERLFLLEPIAYSGKDRHEIAGPLYSLFSLRCQAKVFHVMRHFVLPELFQPCKALPSFQPNIEVYMKGGVASISVWEFPDRIKRNPPSLPRNG
jgi:hypothetical protein